jgi:hypothetical protein
MIALLLALLSIARPAQKLDSDDSIESCPVEGPGRRAYVVAIFRIR